MPRNSRTTASAQPFTSRFSNTPNTAEVAAPTAHIDSFAEVAAPTPTPSCLDSTASPMRESTFAFVIYSGFNSRSCKTHVVYSFPGLPLIGNRIGRDDKLFTLRDSRRCVWSSTQPRAWRNDILQWRRNVLCADWLCACRRSPPTL